MRNKVWFITGTSRGFGRVWAQAALARGDRVVATARDVKTLAPLVERYGDLVMPLTLDVANKAAAAVALAHERFGRLDVVVNNAGYGLFGTIEEVSESEAKEAPRSRQGLRLHALGAHHHAERTRAYDPEIEDSYHKGCYAKFRGDGPKRPAPELIEPPYVEALRGPPFLESDFYKKLISRWRHRTEGRSLWRAKPRSWERPGTAAYALFHAS
jgi:short subunit dehydrogenase